MVGEEMGVELPGVGETKTVGVGHVGNNGGGRVGDSEETSGGGTSVCGTGSVGGDGCVGGVGGYGSMGGVGSDGSVGGDEGIVAHTDIRFAHAGVGGVDGLGVGGHL